MDQPPDIRRKKGKLPILLAGVLGAVTFALGSVLVIAIFVSGSGMHGGPNLERVAVDMIAPAFVGFGVGSGIVVLYRSVKKT